jgi:MFS family permease
MLTDTADAASLEGPHEPSGSVLRNTAFLRLWMAQLVSQTAQNGLMFTLLILVTARTESSLIGSVLVLTFMLPAVLLSLIAGVLVDRWRKRTVLIVTNAIRVALMLSYLVLNRQTPPLLLVTLVFSSVSQFFGPAESSMIPVLVSRRQLISANSFFQLTLTGSQFLGMVVLSPVLLKVGGGTLYFAVAAGLYALATVLVYTLPKDAEPPVVKEPFNGFGVVRAEARDVSE